MERLKMQTPDLVNKNIEQIAKLFPHVITETQDEDGNIKATIDFDLLKQTLSDVLVEDNDERYRVDWPGKKASLLKTNMPITKTLRPAVEDSIEFAKTKNLFIEGDNFEVLKILQESYLGKVKVIYIDPPYNTGNDFIYKDNFKQSQEEYEVAMRVEDEDGGKLFRNTDSNGRFHSDWLSMMYERLNIARDLLKDDGVIFISIDDNEVHNLRKICDEVFGEYNFIGMISRATGTRMGTGSRGIARELDYVLIYSKFDSTLLQKLPMTISEVALYNEEDDRGKYLTRSLRRTGGENRREDRPTMFYPITTPDGDEILPLAPEGWDSRWVCGKETYENLIKDNFIEWKKVKKNGEEKWQVYQKHYLNVEGKESSDLWAEEAGNKKGTRELNALFGGNKVFNHPKPVEVLKKIIKLGASDHEIVMDFFAGSGGIAQAVMELNIEENYNLSYLLIQLPEPLDDTEKKAKHNKVAIEFLQSIGSPLNIAEISKERIRRAGKKIVEDLKNKNLQLKLGQESVDMDKLDIGFRVFKTDDTNLKDVFYHPESLSQDQLSILESNIKEDRTPEDLLTQVILDLGLELSLPIAKKKMLKNSVFVVQHNALVACFDEDIDFAIVDDIAELEPFKVVFRDACFKDDKDRINVEERFKRLSPETVISVI